MDPSSAKAKAAKPLGEYAKQYLDSLAGQVDSSTVDGYAAIYRAHIGPVFGSTPVASITTADVARFRAQLLAPHAERSFVTRGQPRPKPKGSKPANRRTVTRSPKTVKHIVGTLKRMLDTALDDRAIDSNPVVSGRRHTTKRRAGDKSAFKHRPLSSSQERRCMTGLPASGTTRCTRWRCCSRRTAACGQLSCKGCNSAT